MSMFLKRYAAYHRIAKPLLFIIMMSLFLLLNFSFSKNQQKSNHTSETIISFNNNIDLKTQISDTKEKRTIGLSEHKLLNNDEAMLFVFEQPGYYGFHMPNMNFPIDIFWLDIDKKIVHIKKSAQPEDYPEVYIPPQPALYVVETVDGFAEEYGVRIGDMFTW